MAVAAAPKSIEHPVSCTGLEAAAVVDDLEPGTLGGQADPHLDARCGWGMRASVGQEVREHLSQGRLVTHHVHWRSGDQRDRSVGLHGASVMDGINGQRGEVDVRERQRTAFVESRQRQEGIDQTPHTGRLVLDAGDRAG